MNQIYIAELKYLEFALHAWQLFLFWQRYEQVLFSMCYWVFHFSVRNKLSVVKCTLLFMSLDWNLQHLTEMCGTDVRAMSFRQINGSCITKIWNCKGLCMLIFSMVHSFTCSPLCLVTDIHRTVHFFVSNAAHREFLPVMSPIQGGDEMRFLVFLMWCTAYLCCFNHRTTSTKFSTLQH